MVNPNDARLIDPVLFEEIDLLTELVIAASLHDKPISPREIDEALGLTIPAAPRQQSASPTVNS